MGPAAVSGSPSYVGSAKGLLEVPVGPGRRTIGPGFVEREEEDVHEGYNGQSEKGGGEQQVLPGTDHGRRSGPVLLCLWVSVVVVK